MNAERYDGKIASKTNAYTLILNKGTAHGVKIGDIFKIVSLGDMIIDPDSGEPLDALEIVKGTVKVTHIQEKISTLESIDYISEPDKQEIVKRSAGSWGILGQETVTITPGKKKLKPLNDVCVGDYVIKSSRL
jgi:hypothetical protein